MSCFLVTGVVSAQPVLESLQPVDRATHYNSSYPLSFQVTSEIGVQSENIHVFVNGIIREPEISGSSSFWMVSYENLAENQIYDARIEITDDQGAKTVQQVRFDTFLAENFVIEAENSNFDGGGFIDGPTYDDWVSPNYRQAVSVSNIDHVGASKPGGRRDYRVDDIVPTYDIMYYNADQPLRPHLENQYLLEYAVSNIPRGGWLNYTRTFPKGSYFVYGRLAAKGVINTHIERVTSDPSVENQETEGLGAFAESAGTGSWQVYGTFPLTDASGKPVIIELDGLETLRVSFPTTSSNVNFIAFVSAEGSGPLIADIHPLDNAIFHDSDEGITFIVTSGVGVNVEDISLILNGEDRSAELVGTGEANSWEVSFDGLEVDQVHQADIRIVDLNGQETVRSINFDTFNRNHFSFEVEDWNFNGGEFIDNPPILADVSPNYRETVGTQGIDKNVLNTGGVKTYRINETKATTGWSSVNANGVKRPRNLDEGVDEYNVEYMKTDEWFNYTRTFPTGSYHIYGYMAAAEPIENFLDRVTGDTTQPEQATSRLGSFTHPATGNWQVYDYIPLTDDNGDLAIVDLNGEETLRFTVGSGQANVNFFILVPTEREIIVYPELNISRSGDNAVLAWEAEGWVLEASINLEAGSWQEISSTSPWEEEFVDFGRRFYRLRRE